MTSKDRTFKQAIKGERGSLALEQVLFIGAVVALSVGVFVFYDNLADYFRNIDISTLPTQMNSGQNGSS